MTGYCLFKNSEYDLIDENCPNLLKIYLNKEKAIEKLIEKYKEKLQNFKLDYDSFDFEPFEHNDYIFIRTYGHYSTNKERLSMGTPYLIHIMPIED